MGIRRERSRVHPRDSSLVFDSDSRALGNGRTETANRYGVHDLHGLVWEWVADFSTAMVSGDARGDTRLDRQLFCGAGSEVAKDRSNFPAFMRYGFRSSLKGELHRS